MQCVDFYFSNSHVGRQTHIFQDDNTKINQAQIVKDWPESWLEPHWTSLGCAWVHFCHGSWVPGPILTVSCLCAYVWAGVCGCVWLRLIRSSWESSPLGYICSCHALSFVRSLQCLRSSFTVRSGSAIPEPCCFLDSDHRTFGCPLLPCATRVCPTESSVSAYGKLRLCPTESSVSAYGKLRLCPTESSVSAYGKLRLCLRRAPLLVLAVYYFL